MEIIEFIYSTLLFALKGNRDFFKLIDEFHDKLPPKHKRARKNSSEKLYFTILDTTKMEMNLTTTEIDQFHKKLENFKYNKIYFGRKRIQAYSNNLQRLLSSSGNEKFGIAMIQNLIEDETLKKVKPYLFGYRIGKIIGY